MFGLFRKNVKAMLEKRDVEGLVKLFLSSGVSDAKTKSRTAVAIAQIGWPAIDVVYEFLRRTGKDPTVTMMQVLATPELLRFPLAFLGATLGNPGVDRFLATIDDQNEDILVRIGVVKALGIIAQESFFYPLVKIMKDKSLKSGQSSFLRHAALDSLVMMQNPVERLAIVVGVLEFGQDLVDPAFLELIGHVKFFKGNPKIIDAIVEALTDEAIQLTAIRGLAKVGDKTAIKPLRRLAEHSPDYDTHRKATEAIELIQKRVVS